MAAIASLDQNQASFSPPSHYILLSRLCYSRSKILRLVIATQLPLRCCCRSFVEPKGDQGVRSVTLRTHACKHASRARVPTWVTELNRLFFFFCFGKVNAYLNAISLRRQLLQNFKQLVNVAKLCDVSCLTLKFIKRDVLAVLRSSSDY